MAQRCLAILFALLLSACGGQGKVYNRPPEQVRELLGTVEVPLYMYGNTAETEATLDASDPTKIVWKVRADDHPLMSFTATLSPEGESKTRVAMDIKGTDVGKFKRVGGFLAKEKEVRSLYLVTMTEAVDSTLEGRVFDITRTYPALMNATVSTAGRLFPLPNDKRRNEPAAQD